MLKLHYQIHHVNAINLVDHIHYEMRNGQIPKLLLLCLDFKQVEVTQTLQLYVVLLVLHTELGVSPQDKEHVHKMEKFQM